MYAYIQTCIQTVYLLANFELFIFTNKILLYISI